VSREEFAGVEICVLKYQRIILGCLLALALIAGGIKLYMNKQRSVVCKSQKYFADWISRMEKNTKIAEMEGATKSTDREKLVNRRKNPKEGDLFGVRAIEHGYFGGVAQSRPSSPTPSYLLAPTATLVDWSKTPKAGSSSSSLADFSSSRNGSVTSLPVSLNQAKRKPSPLRLQPSDAELSGRRNHDPASIGGIGGMYMPPLPSPRSNRSVTPCADSQKPDGWVNPLDIHFTRPSTPVSSSRPASYLPRLAFPGDVIKNALLVPTPSGSVTGPRSEQASIISNEVSVPAPPVIEPPPKASPTFSVFPQIPSRAARQSGRSIFPMSDDAQRPSSRRSPKESKFDFGIPPVPLENLPPQITTIDPNQFPQDTRKWNPGSPIIRDSIVSKQRVSVYRPTHAHEEPQDALKLQNRPHSIAASSIYSTRTSIVDEPQEDNPQSRSRSRSRDTTGRNRSRSSHKRSSSTQSLSRTQDSLRRHSRKQSQDSLRGNKRHSRQRDQLHFDPTQTQRNRSGSVQGRTVDFDHPRESPFSNANAISHSASTSISSSSSISSRKSFKPTTHDPIPKIPTLAINNPDPERLSVNTITGLPGRNRSASEASQGSIGDFYDAYYRQSIMAQRASVAAQANMLNLRSSGLLMPGSANSGWRDVGRRPAPAPLKLGPGSVGGAGLAGETIMEVASPGPSPGGRRIERFPKLVFVAGKEQMI